MAYRVGTRRKPVCCSLIGSCSRARTEAAIFLGLRAIGDRRFRMGPQSGTDADISGVSNDPHRFGLARPHGVEEAFKCDLEIERHTPNNYAEASPRRFPPCTVGSLHH